MLDNYYRRQLRYEKTKLKKICHMKKDVSKVILKTKRTIAYLQSRLGEE